MRKKKNRISFFKILLTIFSLYIAFSYTTKWDKLIDDIQHLERTKRKIYNHVRYIYVSAKYPEWISEWYRPDGR